MMQAIASRLAECGLMMHPEKSKIVYCKDSNRTQAYPHVYFTFLGFTFRPRKALSKARRLFTSFLPGASADAMKKMRQAVRGWKLNRQTHVALAALAKLYNPVIQGWWNYYGTFYPNGHAPYSPAHRPSARTMGQTQVQEPVGTAIRQCAMAAETEEC